MLAPRYIPTDLQTIHFEREAKKHQRKLDEIVGEDRKKKVVDKEGAARAKLYETREKNLKFHNSEKLLAIEKDNELLLGRLVEISRKKGPTGTLHQSSHLPKTLNGPSRQREKDRIALENEAFAKRLLSQQARFDRKKLEVDYKKHMGLIKQMKRLDNPSTRKIKLPPLQRDQPTEEEKEDRAEEEERREKEEKEKKEKKEREEKERKEQEEKEAHEKNEKEAKEKEEKERKEKEEKEAHEKKEREEKEAHEKEEKEKKEKEQKEAQEKKEREEKEAKEKEEQETKEKEEKEVKEKEENEEKPKEDTAEDKKY